MRRIFMLLAFCTAPIAILAKSSQVYSYQSNISGIHTSTITNRGLIQIREQRILEEMERSGISGSNQYLDGNLHVDRSNHDDSATNHKYTTTIDSFMMGTTSNFVDYPKLRLGVDYGYFKSRNKFEDVNDSHSKVRSHEFALMASYELEDFQLSAYSGYGISANHIDYVGNYAKFREEKLQIGLELGKYIILGDKLGYFYPYAGTSHRYIHTPKYDMVDLHDTNITSGNIGLTYYKDFRQKILLTCDIAYNHRFTGRETFFSDGVSYDKLDVDHANYHFTINIGYFSSPDFIINARYLGFASPHYYYDAIGIGLSHNF